MHYFHTREESAEILRRALQWMAPHQAALEDTASGAASAQTAAVRFTHTLRDPLTGLNNRHGFQRAIDVLGASGCDLDGVALLAADVARFLSRSVWLSARRTTPWSPCVIVPMRRCIKPRMPAAIE
jgi:hypothetical protein